MPDSLANRSRARLCLILLAVAAASAPAVAGCGEEGGDGGPADAPDYERALNGAPPPLAKLYDRGDALVDGGTEAFQRQLEGLRGYPVVINNWASWCGPCRVEWPLFQEAAAKLGTRVAFIGINTTDGTESAETFLRDSPLPYPSYTDPDWALSEEFLPGLRSLPKTAFYDANGKRRYVHQGGYGEKAALLADIERYALGG